MKRPYYMVTLGYFRFFLRLATGFYRTGANRHLPTFNYARDALPPGSGDRITFACMRSWCKSSGSWPCLSTNAADGMQ